VHRCQRHGQERGEPHIVEPYNPNIPWHVDARASQGPHQECRDPVIGADYSIKPLPGAETADEPEVVWVAYA